MTAADVIEKCRTIAGYSEESGFTTRRFLSAPMQLVHRDLTAWMQQIGMDVHVDAAGNLRGRHEGTSPGASSFFVGSHLDTVPHAGAFDGVLGVVLGIALVELVNRERLPFAIEVIGFSDEEGVRFGVPFIGSRAFSGTLDAALLASRDDAGLTIADAIAGYGLPLEELHSAATPPGGIGYLEIHIEQGPVLDGLGAPLGVVDAIVGQTRVETIFTGSAGHAGTTPMTVRRDALAGAAEWIVCVERLARDVSGLVATVGRVEPRPGASNVIAGECTAMLDVRHADDGVRADAVGQLRRAAEEIAERRGLTVAWSPKLDHQAVPMDPALTAALDGAVRKAGVPLHHLSSGAGHDAMVVASRMPVAMLLVRSPGGLSHHPDESVRQADVAAALDVGSRFLRSIATGVSRPGRER